MLIIFTKDMAKRSQNFSEGANKRRKTMAVSRRSPKPECKEGIVSISYTGATLANFHLTAVPTGADQAQRLGAKIKSLRIDCAMQSANGPIKVDLYIPKAVGTLFTGVYSDPMDPDSFILLKSFFVNSGQNEFNREGMFYSHKLPYGVVTSYDTTNVRRNPIYARITTPSADTVTGYFRLWYVDN